MDDDDNVLDQSPTKLVNDNGSFNIRDIFDMLNPFKFCIGKFIHGLGFCFLIICAIFTRLV